MDIADAAAAAMRVLDSHARIRRDIVEMRALVRRALDELPDADDDDDTPTARIAACAMRGVVVPLLDAMRGALGQYRALPPLAFDALRIERVDDEYLAECTRELHLLSTRIARLGDEPECAALAQ